MADTCTYPYVHVQTCTTFSTYHIYNHIIIYALICFFCSASAFVLHMWVFVGFGHLWSLSHKGYPEWFNQTMHLWEQPWSTDLHQWPVLIESLDLDQFFGARDSTPKMDPNWLVPCHLIGQTMATILAATIHQPAVDTAPMLTPPFLRASCSAALAVTNSMIKLSFSTRVKTVIPIADFVWSISGIKEIQPLFDQNFQAGKLT